MPGPSNLYGVASPVALPLTGEAVGPVNCNPSVETIIVTMPAMAAPSAGYFYPMLWFSCSVQQGATVPTSITIAAKIGAGSDFDSFYVVPASYMVNNYGYFSSALVGAASNVAWQGSGSVLNLTCNPAGQLVIVYNIKWVAALFRAPDQ